MTSDRCPECRNLIGDPGDHKMDCSKRRRLSQPTIPSATSLETQDTEPLSPDAARIVALERALATDRRLVELMTAAIEATTEVVNRSKPVLVIALQLGRQWAKGSSMTSDDYANLHHLNALAEAVRTYDITESVRFRELAAEAERLGLREPPQRIQPKG